MQHFLKNWMTSVFLCWSYLDVYLYLHLCLNIAFIFAVVNLYQLEDLVHCSMILETTRHWNQLTLTIFQNHCLSGISYLYSYLYLYLYLRRYTTGGGEGLTAGRRLLPDYYWLLTTSTPEPSSTADQPHVQRQQLFFFWTLRDNSILQSTIHTLIPHSTLHPKNIGHSRKRSFFSFLLCYFASGCQHHLQFACRWKLWRKCDHPIWPGFANFSPQMRT